MFIAIIDPSVRVQHLGAFELACIDQATSQHHTLDELREYDSLNRRLLSS